MIFKNYFVFLRQILILKNYYEQNLLEGLFRGKIHLHNY